MEEIARLEPGQAYYFTEGLYAPLQIIGLDAQTFLGLNEKTPPDNHQLQEKVAKEEWHVALKKRRYGEKIHALTEALDLFKKTMCRLKDHCSLYGQDLRKFQDVSGNEEIFQSVYALHGDVENDRKKFAESYQQFVSCVSSLPEDLVPFIESDIADQYKQTVHAYRQTLNDALYLESSFKQLKQEIMELIRKEDHHERKRNQRKRVPRA
jgi:DNA-binding ferritin-like protein (Dps family)